MRNVVDVVVGIRFKPIRLTLTYRLSMKMGKTAATIEHKTTQICTGCFVSQNKWAFNMINAIRSHVKFCGETFNLIILRGKGKPR